MFTKGNRWIESCTADGWQVLEVDGHFTKLFREGYIMHVYSKSVFGKAVSAWGPDRLALELPEEYDWEVMQANVNLCSMCGLVGLTMRLGFAGRVCLECRKANVARVEYPGWCS